MEKPQIILHIQKSVNYTLFDTKWIPCSAKFVALGNYARGSGALQIYEVSHGDVKCIFDVSIDLSSQTVVFIRYLRSFCTCIRDGLFLEYFLFTQHVHHAIGLLSSDPVK